MPPIPYQPDPLAVVRGDTVAVTGQLTWRGGVVTDGATARVAVRAADRKGRPAGPVLLEAPLATAVLDDTYGFAVAPAALSADDWAAIEAAAQAQGRTTLAGNRPTTLLLEVEATEVSQGRASTRTLARVTLTVHPDVAL